MKYSIITLLVLISLGVILPSHAQLISVPDSIDDFAAIPGNREILLTWVAPFDGGSTVKSYKIEMWETGKDVVTTYYNLGTTITEARISGLKNDISYSFKIFAINEKGQGPDSSVVNSIPSGSSTSFLPEKIVDLVATRGDQKISLKWTAPFNYGERISSFHIYYWQEGTDEIKTKTISGDAKSSQITGLTNGIPYSFKIIAKNLYGHGPDSNVVSETPSASTLSSIPSKIRGINAIPSNNQVFLSWIQPSSNGSPITSYQVLVSEQDSTTTTTFPNLSDDTKTTITGLKNGIKYNFRIIAVNSVGMSFPSDPVSATPENRVSIEITNLRALKGDGSVTLTWSVPESSLNQLAGYWVREYKTGESKFITHVILDKTTTTVITGLENGVSYGFSVIPVTELGIGPASKIIQVTPIKQTIFGGTPGQITDLKATSGPNQVILSWQPPNDSGFPISGYEVQQKIRGENSYTTIKQGRVTSSTIIGLTNGVTYDFKVMAQNSVGLGPESDTVSAIPMTNTGILLPSWIKTNALWWAQDKISDIEYVTAIEYLINNGIIKLK